MIIIMISRRRLVQNCKSGLNNVCAFRLIKNPPQPKYDVRMCAGT